LIQEKVRVHTHVGVDATTRHLSVACIRWEL
jgi:hypothetical protein